MDSRRYHFNFSAAGKNTDVPGEADALSLSTRIAWLSIDIQDIPIKVPFRWRWI